MNTRINRVERQFLVDRMRGWKAEACSGYSPRILKRLVAKGLCDEGGRPFPFVAQQLEELISSGKHIRQDITSIALRPRNVGEGRRSSMKDSFGNPIDPKSLSTSYLRFLAQVWEGSIPDIVKHKHESQVTWCPYDPQFEEVYADRNTPFRYVWHYYRSAVDGQIYVRRNSGYWRVPDGIVDSLPELALASLGLFKDV